MRVMLLCCCYLASGSSVSVGACVEFDGESESYEFADGAADVAKIYLVTYCFLLLLLLLYPSKVSCK